MWSDQDNSDTEPQLEIDDIQGDILIGLQKDFEWFVFFQITDLDKFKEFARNNLGFENLEYDTGSRMGGTDSRPQSGW